MTKSQRLRGLVCGRYSSVSALARHMSWGRQKLQRIISGQQIPTVQEVYEMAVSLELSLWEMAEFFLDQKSPNEQQARMESAPVSARIYGKER